ncbi:hypothetical protein FHS83_001234 [Rhizomicrobium palustre]|uniref:Haem-binding uptake Tiki superfamily ChaN domain-containing protein n=1 Tax=Rhizomicrobium palustre TaxID=189966 RepID=A0A846MWY3_9PROT|nr:hypothetical protein [Rhizomicrobium palustre]NIK87916.1 hypothetical protein [Rhizomicrobium palustre]
MWTRRSLLASAVAALALSPRLKAASLADSARLLVNEGRYLPLLQQMQAEAPLNPPMKDPLAQILAMTGDESAAMEGSETHGLAAPDLAELTAANALEAIVDAARRHQIVILNEAHHISRCRVFAERLMMRLRQEGFTHFAAETFTNTERAWPNAAMTALNAGAPITAGLGWYLADPVFAELVRAARKLGYRFVSYEVRPEQMQEAGATPGRQIEVREDAEANNFIAHVLEADSKAKVFVYCGYDHVLKAEVYTHQLWFAARLKAKSGIEPLCISQAWTVPPPSGLPEEPLLAAILDQFHPTEPVILRDSAGEAVRLSIAKKAIDFEVIHPRLADVSGRPGWLATAPGRKEARYKLTEIPPEGALLQAVPASEAANPAVIPSDQYPASLNAHEAIFFLKPGTYEVRVENEEGRHRLGALTV